MSEADLEKRVAALEAVVRRIVGGLVLAAGGTPRGGTTSPAAPTAGPPRDSSRLAPASDLDGRFGDPTLKRDPKRWQGRSYAGKRFSQTEPDYLDELSNFLEWRSDQEEAEGKAKYAGYSRSDAARARGWAARMRAGWKPPPETPSTNPYASNQGESYGSNGNDPFTNDDEIPF